MPAPRLFARSFNTKPVSDSTQQLKGLWDDATKSQSNGLPINSPQPTSLETDGFSGKILFLHRLHESDETANPYAEHFGKRKRCFELRIQGKFTREVSDLFLTMEWPKEVQLGTALRFTVGWLMGVGNLLSKARGVDISYQLDPGVEDCVQHIGWPLKGADTIVATPDGEEPPDLTKSFKDTKAAEKDAIDFNAGHTYTFVYYCMYANFATWEICNLPGRFTSRISRFMGDQPIHICAYDLKDPEDGKERVVPHRQSFKRYIMHLVVRSSLSLDGAVLDEDGELEEEEAQALPAVNEELFQDDEWLSIPSDDEDNYQKAILCPSAGNDWQSPVVSSPVAGLESAADFQSPPGEDDFQSPGDPGSECPAWALQGAGPAVRREVPAPARGEIVGGESAFAPLDGPGFFFLGRSDPWQAK
mmetsp:Transcript_40004/g.89827  ORF Transcript_40004/g.89827 Transcript_40004/m.89827 type:complete len:417 (-) Transcript_40004:251-1501(-)